MGFASICAHFFSILLGVLAWGGALVADLRDPFCGKCQLNAAQTHRTIFTLENLLGKKDTGAKLQVLKNEIIARGEGRNESRLRAYEHAILAVQFLQSNSCPATKSSRVRFFRERIEKHAFLFVRT